MSNVPVESTSRIERFFAKSYPYAGALGGAAIGGTLGFAAGEHLAPEGHEVLSIGLETVAGGVAGFVVACVGGGLGYLLSLRTQIAGHRAETQMNSRV